jgi:CRISPR-associated protein (TIGR03984 family)
MPNSADFVQIRQIQNACKLHHDNSIIFAEEDDAFRSQLLHIWGKSDAWILGHVTEGVIWGKIVSEKIILAHDADVTFGPPLNVNELLDLRLFNTDQELRIWKSNRTIKGCLVREDESKGGCLTYDEDQIFLSAHRIKSAECEGVTFSKIQGPAGQTQSLPIDWNGEKQTWRLKVRHYLEASDTGMLMVNESRLMDVIKLQGKGGKDYAAA